MPAIKKSVKKTMPATNGELMDIDDIDVGGLRICIYGRGKTGKTRLASTFPKPLLILGTQGYVDVRSILKENRQGCKFVLVESGDQFERLVKGEGPNFKTVVLDTAGGLQDIKLKEVLGLQQDDAMDRTWGMAQQRDWGVCGSQTKQCLRWLLDLSKQGTNAVVVAHERWMGEESELTDVVTTRVCADLMPSVSGWLNGACDYVCHTFIREETVKESIKVMGKDKATEKGTGRIQFCLRVGPNKLYYTGFRTAGQQLPEDGTIVDPTYERIAELI